MTSRCTRRRGRERREGVKRARGKVQKKATALNALTNALNRIGWGFGHLWDTTPRVIILHMICALGHVTHFEISRYFIVWYTGFTLWVELTVSYAGIDDIRQFGIDVWALIVV